MNNKSQIIICLTLHLIRKKLKLLRLSNDDAQRVDQTKFQEIKETIREMRTKYEDWAKGEKLLLSAMDQIASKKLKLSKDEFQKQNDRNKTIQENLINAIYDRRRQSMRQSLGQAPTISQNTIRQCEQTYEPYIPEELVIFQIINSLKKEMMKQNKSINKQSNYKNWSMILQLMLINKMFNWGLFKIIKLRQRIILQEQTTNQHKLRLNRKKHRENIYGFFYSLSQFQQQQCNTLFTLR